MKITLNNIMYRGVPFEEVSVDIDTDKNISEQDILGGTMDEEVTILICKELDKLFP